VRLALVLALITAFVVAGRLLPLGPWIAEFQSWVRGTGPAGYLAYIALYVVFCVLLLPASPLTIGAGAIFGFAKGSLVVMAGGTLGATASFLLARGVLRRRVVAMTAGNARFEALDRAIAREGGRIVFLVRLAPVFPFSWINFAFGLTAIRTTAYVAATFFGILPLTLLFVYLSSAAAGAVLVERSAFWWWINGSGVLVSLLVTAWLTRLAARAVRRAGLPEA
jgi:uncharacterized membrane protein YdjX (TVP38/TMEM64 family)